MFIVTSVIITPLLIFCARVIDVSLSTVHVIFINRGLKRLAPLVGFFTILVWLFAITQIMQHLDHWFNYVAYAGGFATGTYVGIWLEEKLAVGMILVRIITEKEAAPLIQTLKSSGFGVTVSNAQGTSGPVKIVYTVIQRKNQGQVIDIIEQTHPKAFFSTEDIRAASQGIFPKKKTRHLS